MEQTKPHLKQDSRRHQLLEYLLPALFFAGLLLVGFYVYKDYGLTWDDLAQIEIGRVNFDYIFNNDPTLLQLKNRYYGPLFEVILYNLTHALPDPQLFQMRHLYTFLIFYFGMFFFYLLAKRITKSWFFALLGCLILAATPRIFAHSFYNSKDIPFMAMFIIAIYSLIVFLDKPSLPGAILHGIISAILISLRAPGILIVALTVGGLLLDGIFKPDKTELVQKVTSGIAYILVATGFMVLFWPILWHAPFEEFLNAILQMGKFPWLGGTVFYRAKFVEADQLPWHYIPLWVLITTPLSYLVLFGTGVIKVGLSFIHIKNQLWTPAKRNYLLVSAWGLVPVLTVILLKSVLYDGWRQMFFIYPAIVLFATLGLQSVCTLNFWGRHKRLTTILGITVIALIFIEPVNFMIRYHPHQNVYFNHLAGRDMQRVKRHYELDYWGLSYKQGLEFILENDPSGLIKINTYNAPGRINARILPQPEAKRIKFVETPEEADYFITNYRWHPEFYDYPNEIFQIRIGNASILSVFKMKP